MNEITKTTYPSYQVSCDLYGKIKRNKMISKHAMYEEIMLVLRINEYTNMRTPVLRIVNDISKIYCPAGL